MASNDRKTDPVTQFVLYALWGGLAGSLIGGSLPLFELLGEPFPTTDGTIFSLLLVAPIFSLLLVAPPTLFGILASTALTSGAVVKNNRVTFFIAFFTAILASAAITAMMYGSWLL